MGVVVREAGQGDRETVGRLLAEYLFEFDGRTEPYPYFDAYWAEPQRVPLLIEDEGRAIGLCLIRMREDGWSIAEFSVTPGQRRAGIGRAVVEMVAERAAAAGASYLEAKVHSDNRAALPFWLAVGFRVVEAPGVFITRRYL